MREADVVVVGGGVVGLSSARAAAQAGLDVVVAAPAAPVAAGWQAAGMLPPGTEADFGEERLLELNLAAADRWPAFAEAVERDAGVEIGYRRDGALLVARSGDEIAWVDRLADHHRRAGLSVERLRGSQARRVEPSLAPTVAGALQVDLDGQVDNRALLVALRAAAERAGARLVDRPATRLLVGDGGVEGVELGDDAQRVRARSVVLAAGCWSGRLDGLPEQARPPVRPVRGELLHLRHPAGEPVATRILRSFDVYLVPRPDGRLVVGATAEERGFDDAVSAGGVRWLLAAAAELLPAVDDLELVEAAAGLRPGSPDNLPIVGPTAVDGLVVATGHWRNGLLLAPVTAELVVAGLTGRPTDLPAEVVAPARFAEGREVVR